MTTTFHRLDPATAAYPEWKRGVAPEYLEQLCVCGGPWINDACPLQNTLGGQYFDLGQAFGVLGHDAANAIRDLGLTIALRAQGFHAEADLIEDNRTLADPAPAEDTRTLADGDQLTAADIAFLLGEDQ